MDQHCYTPEKMPSLSRKHDGEKPRTNTATHQKNALVIQKTRWIKPKDQHCYDLKKCPRYPTRKHDGEKPRTNTTTI